MNKQENFPKEKPTKPNLTGEKQSKKNSARKRLSSALRQNLLRRKTSGEKS
jgi:hypothetical protein